MDLSTFVNYLEIGMALFALVSFFYAVHEGRKATKEYRRALRLSEEYDRLVNEYRGRILDWKELVEALAHQVSTETEMIMLAIDTLAYGAVTVPKAHRRFWSALIGKAAARVPIHIVTFNENAQLQMIKEQFGEDMAHSPTGDVAREMREHFEYIDVLRKQGKESVDIVLSSYFPLHLFIFQKNKTAIFALQELPGDGTVRAYAVETHDPVLVEICRQSFAKLQRFAREVKPNRLTMAAADSGCAARESGHGLQSE